ncbi:MAG: hybrid sensor histidine kinase/response regulator [Bacteroidetes bacterium]|nr:hybrid sensor histidine kinase/response regulator [Bacteroidota bacterium]
MNTQRTKTFTASHKKEVKIFLVDDNKMFVNALKHSLTRGSNNITDIKTFFTGEECLQSIDYNPTIVILDYYLNSKFPDALDGLQILKSIKQSHPGTEVIMLSSQDSIRLAADTLKHGAYDYITKGEGSFIKIRNLVKHISDNIELNECIDFHIYESLKIRTLLEAITDILIVLSPEGELKFINREGANILNINLRKKGQHNYFLRKLLVNSKCFDRFMRKLFTPVINGEKISNYSAKLVAKSGRKISVLISSTSFNTPLKEKQILLLIRDVSGYIQTEKQLKEREDQLKERTDELNTFMYRAAHDLRSPNASILGLLNLAKNKYTDLPVEKILEKIELSAVRLDNILSDFIKMIHLSHAENQIIKIDFVNNINEILGVIKNSEIVSGTAINWNTNIKIQSPFYSDKNLIDTILYNLIMNSVKYSKTGTQVVPCISVDINEVEKGIEITVSDNGIGISKEIQKKVFNIFFRGTDKSTGSGLGLHIVKRAVKLLKGKISLKSETDTGTKFTVLLPSLRQTIN